MLLQSFYGDTLRLSIDAWIDRYEMLAKRRGFSEDDMVIELGSYLIHEGLEWYMSVMGENERISFPELKNLLLQRFGVKSIDPMSECVDLRYDPKLGMKSYFEQKSSLGMKAGLKESQIISLMIHSLPPNMSSAFNTIRPKSMEEFFHIAKMTENSVRVTNSGTIHTRQHRERGRMVDTKKPSGACKICERLGYPRRYHWAQDCWNKNRETNGDRFTNNKRPKLDGPSSSSNRKALN